MIHSSVREDEPVPFHIRADHHARDGKPLPLHCSGRIHAALHAGGIGVGGGTEEQDCQIAEYVVSVFEQETKTILGK